MYESLKPGPGGNVSLLLTPMQLLDPIILRFEGLAASTAHGSTSSPRTGGVVELEQKPTVIEQFAYSDTWSDGTASYLAMITPRLILMRELLSDSGSIYVHLDWHVGHYVKIVMDEVFGKDCFRNEIFWKRDAAGKGAKTMSKQWPRTSDSIYFYTKTDNYNFAQQFNLKNADDERNSDISANYAALVGANSFAHNGLFVRMNSHLVRP